MYPSRPPASLFPCGQGRPRFTSRPLKTAPSELKHFARRAGPPSTRMRPMPMLSAMAFASGASSNGASCRLDSRNGVTRRWNGAWTSRVYRSEIASEALPWRLENMCSRARRGSPDPSAAPCREVLVKTWSVGIDRQSRSFTGFGAYSLGCECAIKTLRLRLTAPSRVP